MKRAVVGLLLGLVVIVIALFAFLGKGANNKPEHSNNSLVVSILPLKLLVSEIIGDDYRIEVLVPPGSSPETYEPSPKQLASLSDADLVFTVGLIDFERELINKATEQADIKVVNLSDGIALLSGSCSSATDGHDHGHHHHGTDPHIWTSPKQLKIMATNVYNAIALLHPDNKTYEANYRNLLAKLDELDARVATMLDSAQVKYFFIYHPAMTYYANDYSITQVSIEQEGKEPSTEQLRNLIDLAREEKITAILYQKEFSRLMVETVSDHLFPVSRLFPFCIQKWCDLC